MLSWRASNGLLAPSLVAPKHQAPRARGSAPPPPISASIDAFVVGFEGVIVDQSTGTVFREANEGLSCTSNPFYVLTSAAPESVSSSLKEGCQLDIPADSPRILSATSSDKMALLLQVNSRPLAQDPANTIHYIDSDDSVLDLVSKDPAFSNWRLYYATWAPERETSGKSKARDITLKDFPELLKWGLLMGVNDGCQEYEDGTPAT